MRSSAEVAKSIKKGEKEKKKGRKGEGECEVWGRRHHKARLLLELLW